MCVENEKEKEWLDIGDRRHMVKVDRRSGRQAAILRVSSMWTINVFITNEFITVGKQWSLITNSPDFKAIPAQPLINWQPHASYVIALCLSFHA